MPIDYTLGHFSPDPEKIKRKRKEAIDARRSPDEAEEKYLEEIRVANEKLKIKKESEQLRIDLGSIDGGAGLK